jgi:polyribonucleotide nucleotidyltransferase
MEGAIRMVREIIEDVEIGKIYRGRVTSVKDFGAFVEVLPGQEGLVHISELSEGYVENINDYVKLGDIMDVKVIDIDNQNRIKLSKKAAAKAQHEAAQ